MKVVSTQTTVSSAFSLFVAASLLAVLAVTGCSGSKKATVDVRYDDRQDSTTYQAGPVQVDLEERRRMQRQSSVTGSPTQRRRRRQRRQRQPIQRTPTLLVEAHGRCGGQKCTPTQVDVTFRSVPRFLRPGPPITLQMGGRTYDWETPRATTPGPGTSDNVIATVTLSWTQFQELAQSQVVIIGVEDTDFESSYEDRAALRTMLSRAGL